MSSTTTYHVRGRGKSPATLTRKHELFKNFVLTCTGFSKLGATRGRAMAMLMDSQYECSDVDEVHIVLGPKSDLKVRMKSDEDLEDDPRAELFEGDIKPHVPGKFGKKGNVLCITMPIELRDRRFIVDSGSGHDLISLNRKCYFVHDIYIYIFVMRHVLRRASRLRERERDIYIYIPVVPHKAVAEVSKIGNL